MLNIGFICLFINILICQCAEKDVTLLSDDTFESETKKYEHSIVMFFAPWCGHCKRMKPEYEKAAEDLSSSEYPIKFFKVDCTESGKETCKKFEVNGYPTLKLFKNGIFFKEYDGGREAAGIVRNLISQVGPTFRPLNTQDEIDKFLAKDSSCVVAYYQKDDKMKSAFESLADKLREAINFAIVTKPELMTDDIKDHIILYRPKVLQNKFEPSSEIYSGEYSNIENLKEWIKNTKKGLCAVRTSDNIHEFSQPLIVAYYDVDYKKNPKGTNYWRNRIMKVAQDYKQQLNFAISPKDELSSELNQFGIEYVKDEKPVICAKNSKGQKFKMDTEFSMENFKKFIDDFLSDHIEPYIKSEIIPEDNTKPLKVVVAKNFDSVVSNDRDVLLEFYAPWCGHCKKLAPVYEKLASKMSKEDIIIAKIDSTANDVPENYNVKGFPTIYWKPKGKSPELYTGGRQLEDFIEYLSKHATNELLQWDRNGKPRKSEL